MKKFLVIIISALLITSLTACSSKKKDNVKVTAENLPYLEEFDTNLQNTLTEMNDILKTFNDSLNDMYKEEISNEQFSTILKQIIDQSNELVTSVEILDSEPELFEAHQNLLSLANKTHQLFLDAIEMANNEKVNKDNLRTSYLSIKEEQATLSNQWKILRRELESTKREE